MRHLSRINSLYMNLIKTLNKIVPTVISLLHRSFNVIYIFICITWRMLPIKWSQYSIKRMQSPIKWNSAYQMEQCPSTGAVPYQRRCNNFVLEFLLLSKIFNFMQKHLEKRIWYPFIILLTQLRNYIQSRIFCSRKYDIGEVILSMQ